MKNVAIMSLSVLWAVVPLLAGCSTILKSADQGNLAKVDGHLQKGTGVDARDEYGRTPLMWGAEDLDVVRHLVEKGADVNARDELGETPLMKAAWVGQLDVVKFLVEKGADVNAKSDGGETPLMRALRNMDVVKFLVEKGADVNAVDKNGETLLLKATSSGRLSVVQYLMKKGAAVESGAAGDSGR